MKDSPTPETEENPSPIDDAQKTLKTPKKSPITLKVAIPIAVIVLIGLGVTGYLYHKHVHTKSITKNTQASQSVVAASGSQSKQTTQYVSNGQDLNLDFSYPQNWTVTPPSNDNPHDGNITVTSPLVSVTDANNKAVTGKIVVLVRPGTSSMTELNSGSPTEALASTQIAYSNPTADQEQYPYLSYIHFSNTASVNGAFEEVLISGSISVSQGQALTTEDFNSIDPVITASFYQCITQTCTGPGEAPLSITSNTWQNSSVFQQVLATLESFKLN